MTTGGVAIDKCGAASIITLDRPEVLNAVSRDMIAALAAHFPKAARDPGTYAVVVQSASAKAFSVGGDIRELAALQASDPAAARAALAAEYGCDWLHECFSKPTISLIDGLMMGSGFGLTQYGTHRVAGEGYQFAMPETAIGFFPDCGACYAFARMPGHIGSYLALTGRRVGRADAYRLGLVTHCISREHFEAIRAGLADADCVDPLLDALHEDPEPGELGDLADVIARCFSAPRVGEIIARLSEESGRNAAFARETAALLEKRSPAALALTHQYVSLARTIDLKAALTMDYRLACRSIAGHDFREGVRALIVEKDNAPRWSPATLAEVDEATIDAMFAPQPSDELALRSREQMQAARV
ncbi:MAG TPA: enoyl-CoA hydratase/isomerase family protein [Hyphomicrobiaceae bacterium]|nr:enoyl-CoA hydratase/isomerase family protein [Hyphomicrobiaceae bacterium]